MNSIDTCVVSFASWEEILYETNGMNDHVHLLLRLPPKLAVSDALRTIKASSSKRVNESKPGFHKFGWQVGFRLYREQVPGCHREQVHS